MGTAEFTSTQVRHLFYTREKQRCFYCRQHLSWSLRGSMLIGGWSVHHRKGRGVTKRVTYADGLVLCGTGSTGCHGDVTKKPAWAFERGLAIPKLATTPEYEPAAVRVSDRAGRWFLLTLDGRAVEVETPTP